MWLIDEVCGGWGAIVGLGTLCRWETGLGLRLGLGLGLGLGLRLGLGFEVRIRRTGREVGKKEKRKYKKSRKCFYSIQNR